MLPFANAAMMNLHLAEISTKMVAGAHAVLVLDGAGWHMTGGRLPVPANVTLPHLSPCSPELNPVENVWAYPRSNKLSNRVLDGLLRSLQLPDRRTRTSHLDRHPNLGRGHPIVPCA